MHIILLAAHSREMVISGPRQRSLPTKLLDPLAQVTGTTTVFGGHCTFIAGMRIIVISAEPIIVCWVPNLRLPMCCSLVPAHNRLQKQGSFGHCLCFGCWMVMTRCHTGKT